MATSVKEEEAPATSAAVMSNDGKPAVLIVGGLGMIPHAVSTTTRHQITLKERALTDCFIARLHRPLLSPPHTPQQPGL